MKKLTEAQKMEAAVKIQNDVIAMLENQVPQIEQTIADCKQMWPNVFYFVTMIHTDSNSKSLLQQFEQNGQTCYNFAGHSFDAKQFTKAHALAVMHQLRAKNENDDTVNYKIVKVQNAAQNELNNMRNSIVEIKNAIATAKTPVETLGLN